MISILAFYLLVAGALIFFLWLRPVARKRTVEGPGGVGLLRPLAGALITWVILPVTSGLLFLHLLKSFLIR